MSREHGRSWQRLQRLGHFFRRLFRKDFCLRLWWGLRRLAWPPGAEIVDDSDDRGENERPREGVQKSKVESHALAKVLAYLIYASIQKREKSMKEYL